MLKPKAKNVKIKKAQFSKTEPRKVAVLLKCPAGRDDGSYEPGRIPGMSEDLATFKRLIESPQLIQIGPSVLLHHTDSLIRSQKSNKVQRIYPP